MDFPDEEFEFLAWYFTFIEGDFFNCPHCGEEIEKDEIEQHLSSDGGVIICPQCGKRISKEDVED